ncbi:glutamine-hydrolyzing carbamoyl-phosphate synthase small subunit [Vampirovibrio chlorellavorus]|uniref:glutamine-hydrolyzing carbamoyl-phosphate synthase small subunit n=1 Tax=Vampirovibrio chlorellavorus TaxID=758823 RepID=UPI0026F0674E|nr:glutamine-hydrolyzing carbamoyl-phosphate synthase small subunit [Vampirovibrio chlorellavorus]
MPTDLKISARLVLEDGSVYHGQSIGVTGTTLGELVFNTSSTGYQEILTDPSYRGQMVLMTYPEIGNYGISSHDFESAHINAVGLVVSRLSPFTSSWRSEFSLQEFLVKNKVVGIEGVDTRAITRKIREKGTLKAGITTEAISDAEFIQRVQAQPGFEELDMISQVTTLEPYTIRTENPVSSIRVQKLVVVDYGIKASILHYLQQYVEEIVVLPAHCDFEQIRALQPQGVLLSNGPGDPAVLYEAVAMARQLVDAGIPTFGICLGHQILGLACGAKVSKMRFGHHGGNHPVKDMLLDKVFITSQNHGYCVEFDEFPEDRLMVTHINLNDQTIEGFQHRNAPVMSVQFHPEASPGPHDANYIFERFMRTAVESGVVCA